MGICSLGALHYFHVLGEYDPTTVKIYAGTSIGSVISLLLVCGYHPYEIFMKMREDKNIFKSKDINNILDIFESGILSNDSLSDELTKLVEAKFGKVLSLQELYDKTKKTLIIPVTNVSKMRCEYYSYKTKPNISCVKAVMLSSNVPVLFKRDKLDDEYIVDGGLTDNFPLQHIDDGIMNILGIATLGRTNLVNPSNFSLGDDNFLSYYTKLLQLPAMANMSIRCKSHSKNTKVIIIESPENTRMPIDFTLSVEKIDKMFLRGYTIAEYERESIDLCVSVEEYDSGNYLNEI